MTGLTFDWDDVELSNPQVQEALIELNNDFSQRVWYRLSSSKNGLHVMIAELDYDTLFGVVLNPIPLPLETQFAYRSKYGEAPWSLECQGRFFSDQVRAAEGFRTSRVFISKNGLKAGPWTCFGCEVV